MSALASPSKSGRPVPVDGGTGIDVGAGEGTRGAAFSSAALPRARKAVVGVGPLIQAKADSFRREEAYDQFDRRGESRE